MRAIILRCACCCVSGWKWRNAYSSRVIMFADVRAHRWHTRAHISFRKFLFVHRLRRRRSKGANRREGTLPYRPHTASLRVRVSRLPEDFTTEIVRIIRTYCRFLYKIYSNFYKIKFRKLISQLLNIADFYANSYLYKMKFRKGNLGKKLISLLIIISCR